MMELTIFWGIISLIFLYLMIWHLKRSSDEFPHFISKGKVAKINGIPLGIKELVKDINDYIDRFNKSNKRMNMAQFWGYLAASLKLSFGTYSLKGEGDRGIGCLTIPL